MAKPNSKPRSKPRSPAKTEKPPDPNELTVFPHQLRAGDRYRDDATGKVWEVVGLPSSLRQGKDVAVRFKGADDPSAEWRQVWPAHERVRIHRAPSVSQRTTSA
jgi:hypothetical protein